MAQDQQSFVIQKMTIAGQEFDLSYMRECTFCETCDLSGPFLQFKFYDPHSVIRNRLEIKEGQYVTITVETIFETSAKQETKEQTALGSFSEKKSGDTISLDSLGSGKELDEIEFRIMSLKSAGDIITVNCIEKMLAILKLPASKKDGAIKPAFVKNIREMAEYLTGDSKGVSKKLPEIDPYHIRAGERPTAVLRRAAREKGCLCFLLRGVLVFAELGSLEPGGQRKTAEDAGREYPPSNQEGLVTQYLHGPVASHHPIVWYRKLEVEQKAQDRIVKAHESFDFIKGRVKSTEKTDEPARLVAVTDEMSLNALSVYNHPVIDFQTYGSTKEFVPGFYSLNLFWMLHDPDYPLDESLPNRVRIWSVFHFYRPSKYFCRIVGVKPPGEETAFTYEK